MAAVRLTSFRTSGEASLLCQTLSVHGIAATVRGENLPQIAGELPLGEVEVEVWIDDADLPAATKVIVALSARSQGGEVTCDRCGEVNPPEFDYCWSCRTALDPKFR